MNIRDVMTPNPKTVSPTETLRNAARLMKSHDTGVLPVVEDGKVVGMVTDRDIVVHGLAEGAGPDKLVRDVMPRGRVIVATLDMSARDANALMSEHQVRRLPVLDANHALVGIVSLGDLAVKEGKDSLVGQTLESISEGVKRVL